MKIEDYNEYYIQGSDHYLIPKGEFKELFNEMINWKEESQKQKEVIDKAIEYILECSINEKGHINVSLSSKEVGKLLDILNEVLE